MKQNNRFSMPALATPATKQITSDGHAMPKTRLELAYDALAIELKNAPWFGEQLAARYRGLCALHGMDPLL